MRSVKGLKTRTACLVAFTSIAIRLNKQGLEPLLISLLTGLRKSSVLAMRRNKINFDMAAPTKIWGDICQNPDNYPPCHLVKSRAQATIYGWIRAAISAKYKNDAIKDRG